MKKGEKYRHTIDCYVFIVDSIDMVKITFREEGKTGRVIIRKEVLERLINEGIFERVEL